MTIEWFVPLGQARSMTMALHSIAADTRTIPGCLGCSVAADLTERNTVRYSEEWRTEDDLRRRMQSDTFSQLIMLIEEAVQSPQIEFKLPQETRGLDFVHEVRAAAK
jgi:quinol monooxygenase YgiN